MEKRSTTKKICLHMVILFILTLIMDLGQMMEKQLGHGKRKSLEFIVFMILQGLISMEE